MLLSPLLFCPSISWGAVVYDYSVDQSKGERKGGLGRWRKEADGRLNKNRERGRKREPMPSVVGVECFSLSFFPPARCARPPAHSPPDSDPDNHVLVFSVVVVERESGRGLFKASGTGREYSRKREREEAWLDRRKPPPGGAHHSRRKRNSNAQPRSLLSFFLSFFSPKINE